MSSMKELLERLQTRLLDLSSRNRLLNYSINRKAVLRFVDAPLNDVYQKLFENPGKNGLYISPMPEPDRGQLVADGKKGVRPREIDWARQQGISITYENEVLTESRLKSKLQTLLYPDECATRTRGIANHARLAIEETGSNMLYLIFGFLEYPDKRDQDKRYLAPLVSMPVSLEKVVVKDAYRYRISYTGDDVNSNLPLAEKLKIDYELAFPVFDDERYDVSEYFARVKRALSKRDDFRIAPMLTLGVIANYADMLLIRDIEPKNWGTGRKNRLLHHPLVKMMIGGESSAQLEKDDSRIDNAHLTSESSLTSQELPTTEVSTAGHGNDSYFDIFEGVDGREETIRRLYDTEEAYVAEMRRRNREMTTRIKVDSEVRAVNDSSHRQYESETVPAVENDPLPLVFDADSSQEAAIHEVVNEGRSIVISGPPGTGKSQTIANMIAALMNHGKKVLFIADKMAALEVVKSRLEKVELGHFLLSLHGNKVNKKEVLDSIAARIEFSRRRDRSIDDDADECAKVQNLLDSYSGLLHDGGADARSNSLYEIVWQREQLIGKLGAQPPHIEIPHSYHSSSLAEIEEAKDLLVELQRMFVQLNGDAYRRLLNGVESQISSPEELPILLDLIDQHERELESLSALNQRLNDRFSLTWNDLSQIQEQLLLEVMNIIRDETEFAQVWDFRKRGVNPEKAFELINDLEEIIGRYRISIADLNSLVGENASQLARYESQLSDASELTMHFAADDTPLTALIRDLEDISQTCSSALTSEKRLEDTIQAVGLPLRAGVEGLSDYDVLIQVLQKGTPEILRVHDPLRFTSERRRALKALVQERRALESSERELSANYHLERLPRDIALQEAKKYLQKGYTWWRRFDSQWRKFIAMVQGCSKHDVSSYYVTLSAIDELLRHIEQQEAHSNNPLWRVVDVGRSAITSELSTLLEWVVWYEDASLQLSAHGFDPEQVLDADSVVVAQRIRRILGIVDGLEHYRSALAACTKRGVQQLAPNLISHRASVSERCGQIVQLADTLKIALEQLQASFGGTVSVRQLQKAASAGRTAANLERHFKLNQDYVTVFGIHYRGAGTDTAHLRRVITVQLALESYRGNTTITKVLDAIDSKADIAALLEECQVRGRLTDKIHELDSQIQRYVKLSKTTRTTTDQQSSSRSVPGLSSHSWVKQYSQQLVPLARYQELKREKPTMVESLKGLIDRLERSELDNVSIALLYDYYVASSTLRKIMSNRQLRSLTSGLLQTQHERYIELDRSIIQRRGRDVASRIIKQSNPPTGHSGSRVDEKTQLQLVNYLIPQTRPRVPIRKLLSNAGAAVQELKPCFMMSPQAVAQFLEPGKLEFDVLIIDEASQVRPEEAIGSIARCKQTVVVGDNQQLPPTSFFMKHGIEEDEEEHAVDTTSVLSLAESHFSVTKSLDWHYRSRHESLIQFSNSAFYRDKLVILPSPHASNDKLGVFVRYVAGARYDSSMNVAEAEHILEVVKEHISVDPNKSIGIVTLNKKQAELIQRVFDERLSEQKTIATYLKNWEEAGTPLFVKNLENVQGDERDVIVISTTYGPSREDGKVSQNFGPISKHGGEKRLNVLFTRAKERVVLVTSMRPEDVSVTPTTPLGTRTLRSYLEYARTSGVQHSNELDDPRPDAFVEYLQQRLHVHGFQCTPYYGVSNNRIDLIVRSQDDCDHILAAIETDGYSYAGARTARDRERIREEVLLNLGWKGRLLRTWTIDWLLDRETEYDRILSELRRLRNNRQPAPPKTDRWLVVGASSEVQSGAPSSSNIEQQEPVSAAQYSAEIIAEEMIEEQHALRVSYGDTVCYIDIEHPDDELTLQIIKGEKDNPESGILSINRPIARVLFDHSIGDEVNLHFPGKKSKVYQILNIKKFE